MASEPTAEYGMDINMLKLKTTKRVMDMTNKESGKKMLAFAGELRIQYVIVDLWLMCISKLIYTIKDEQTIEIAAVWDCRQDPKKL